MTAPSLQPARASLATRIARSGLRGLLLPAALLFISAGTLDYWQGWAYLAVNLVFPALLILCFYRRDPQLIDRRLLKKEKLPEQKLVLKIGSVLYFAALIVPGLDYRFGWTRHSIAPVPMWATALALAVITAAQLLLIWVVEVNRYAARVIQIEAGQTLADTGPYRWVRHPMYAASLGATLAGPLSLGSLVAAPAFVLFIPLMIFRLLNEEKLLRRELPGYVEYCQRTPWRLVPFVW